MKRDKGSAGVGEIIETIVVAFVLMFLFTMLIEYGNQLIFHSKAESIARSYVASMEVTGGLTEDMKEELTSALTDAGFSNISFTGSTNAGTENGKPITLQINANISRRVFSFGGNFVTTKSQSVVVIKNSISKTYE